MRPKYSIKAHDKHGLWLHVTHKTSGSCDVEMQALRSLMLKGVIDKIELQEVIYPYRQQAFFNPGEIPPAFTGREWP